jgi:hypothetical protein
MFAAAIPPIAEIYFELSAEFREYLFSESKPWPRSLSATAGPAV